LAAIFEASLAKHQSFWKFASIDWNISICSSVFSNLRKLKLRAKIIRFLQFLIGDQKLIMLHL